MNQLSSSVTPPSTIPFSLLVPGQKGYVPVDEEYLRQQAERHERFISARPGLRAMADTNTKTTTIKTCTKNTVVHDGNNSYDQEDEHQDGTDTENWQDD